MSPHESERLSAYLDDELSPAARAAVAAHVTTCGKCRALLAALSEADRAAAELPVTAPEGYFEAFAPRVRARLVDVTSRPAPRRWQPVWGWAIAAGLLLAVVTPLTLRGRRTPGEPASISGLPSPHASGVSAVAQAPTGGRRGGSSPDAPSRRPATAAAMAPAPHEAEGGSALPPAEPNRRARTHERVEAPETRGLLPSSLAAVAGGVVEGAPVGVVAGAPAPAARLTKTAATQRAPSAGDASAAKGVAASALEAASEAEAKAARAELSRADRQRDVHAFVAGPTAPAVAAAGAALDHGTPGAAVETAFRRLGAAQPQRLEEWRQLREEWRRFATDHPEGPRADEARVRTVAAGLEVLRRGGGPDDAAAFRADAARYLAREDALQKERVQRLLGLVPETP